MASDDFDTATEEFLEWCSRRGIWISPKVELADLRAEGRGRGLVATDDVEEDETLFSVPHSAVLNVKNAVSSFLPENFPITLAALRDMPSWLSLTFVLMSEILQKHPKWSPYFAVLPSKLNSLVFWLPTELAELQASAVLQKIGKSEAEELYFQKVAPLGMDGVTLEHFHHMASIIMAYAFDIPEDDPERKLENHTDEDLVPDDDEQRTVLTMIPLADMLNADADRNNARLICDNEDLEMRSIKTISKGEEILNDYGLLPRADLLRRYGYITDQYAPYDVVELSTDSLVSALQSGLFLELEQQSLEEFSPADLEARLDLARREDVYEDTYDISHATPEEPSLPDELIALIYLLLIDQFMLSSIQRSESTLPSRSKMATSFLGAVLTKLLEMREKEYPTSLEEDDAILRTGKSSHRCTLAIRVRQGEKIILREAIAEAATFHGSNQHMRGINLKRGTANKATKPAKRIKFS